MCSHVGHDGGHNVLGVSASPLQLQASANPLHLDSSLWVP